MSSNDNTVQMSCPYCHNTLNETAKFCNQCGKAIESNVSEAISEHGSEAKVETIATQKVKPRGVNKVILSFGIIGGIFLLVVGTVLGINAYLDSNPKKLYLLAEANTYHKNQSESLISFFQNELDLMTMLQERPSTIHTELSADVRSSDSSLYDGIIRGFLGDSKLAIETIQHPEQGASHLTFSYFLKGDRKLDFVVVNNEESIGFELPDLYRRMFYLDHSDFGDFMMNLDPYYAGSNESPIKKYKELLAKNAELEEEISKRYADFLLDQLHEDYFTLTNKVEHRTSSGTMRVKQIDLKISESEFKQILNAFIDEVRQDRQLLDMISESAIDMLSDNLSDFEPSYVTYGLPSADDINELMQDALYELKMLIRDMAFPGGFQMTVLIDKNKHIVERKIKLEFEDRNMDSSLALDIHSRLLEQSKDRVKSTFNVTLSDRNMSLSFDNSKSIVQQDKSNKKLDWNILVKLEEDRENVFDITLDVNSSINNSSKNEIKGIHEFDLSLSSFYERYSVRGTLNQYVDQDLNKNYSKQDYSIDLQFLQTNNFFNSRESVTFYFDITNEVEFDDKLEVPGIKDNALNVLRLDSYDWHDILEEMAEELQYILIDEFERLYDYW